MHVRLRCRARQLPRPLPRHRDRRRRPRSLRLRRPDTARSTRAFCRCDRRHRTAAALVARLCQHRDGLGRRARCATTHSRLPRPCRARRLSAVELSLRLGLHQPRQAALRLHLEPRQVSAAGRVDGRLCQRRRAHRRQPEALPARRPPRVFRTRRRRRLYPRRERPLPRTILGRLGRAPGLHARGRPRLVAARLAAADPRRGYRRRLERQQRVRDLGRGRTRRRLRRDPAGAALAPLAGAADDARHLRPAGRPQGGRACLHHHACRPARFAALGADLERRQLDLVAHDCAGTSAWR